MLVVAVVLMVLLHVFVQYTRLGKAMRATAQSRDAAKIMGINVDQIIALTFLIGGALAGSAGILVGLYNNTIVFTMGFTAGLRAFYGAFWGLAFAGDVRRGLIGLLVFGVSIVSRWKCGGWGLVVIWLFDRGFVGQNVQEGLKCSLNNGK